MRRRSAGPDRHQHERGHRRQDHEDEIEVRLPAEQVKKVAPRDLFGDPRDLSGPRSSAMPVERNQRPIITAANLTGVSLVTSERPIGERQSSPSVWKV